MIKATNLMRKLGLCLSAAAACIGVGCAYSFTPGKEVASMSAFTGANRREQLRRRPSPKAPASQPHGQARTATSRPSVVLGAVASRPAGAPDLTTRPAHATTGPAERSDGPVVLETANIVHRVFDTSPLMRASREEMTAADFALQEFRANLSRLEPYVNTKGDTAAYPERLNAEGSTGEVVGGVQKETFEGAILRVEGGAGASQFKYKDVEDPEARVERGSGGLVRARVEVPFIGSRKRQERVISQAFQESQARRARLDYLTEFRTQVVNALSYHLLAILNEDYAQVSEEQAKNIESLLNDVRIKEADRPRLISSMESCRVTRDQYETSRRTYVLLLMALLGYPMDTPFELVKPPDGPSRYMAPLSTPQGRDQMIEDAYANNPRFRVLQDAIRDADLQRQQAILGKYDVTAYMEGTQFPFGATTYDDRLGGWLVGGGVNIRLNDQRVLTASRLKAESQIRQYQAEIEAERLSIERKIIDNSEQLASYHRIREEALQIARKKESEFRIRSAIYFEGSDPTVTIDNVLGPLSEWTVAENRVAANQYYIGLADLAIMTATGELYETVGMEVDAMSTKGDDKSAATQPEQGQK